MAHRHYGLREKKPPATDGGKTLPRRGHTSFQWDRGALGVDARRRALTHSPRPPRPPTCCSLNSWPCRSWRVARVIAKKLWRVICCAYLPLKTSTAST